MFEMVDPLPGAFRLKMPRFVIAWSIIDLVMTALRTLELPFIIAALFLIGRHQFSADPSLIAGWKLVLWLEFSIVTAISVTGLAGNICMLCRRNFAQYICLLSALFTLVSYGFLVWQTLILFNRSSVPFFCIAIIAVTLIIMLRTALLVFNLLSIFKARSFFKERDGY